jgi:hypothetical protein
MTVKELIDILSAYDPDTEVWRTCNLQTGDVFARTDWCVAVIEVTELRICGYKQIRII